MFFRAPFHWKAAFTGIVFDVLKNSHSDNYRHRLVRSWSLQTSGHSCPKSHEFMCQMCQHIRWQSQGVPGSDLVQLTWPKNGSWQRGMTWKENDSPWSMAILSVPRSHAGNLERDMPFGMSVRSPIEIHRIRVWMAGRIIERRDLLAMLDYRRVHQPTPASQRSAAFCSS